MKSRLFWKILFGVWAMLLTMSLAVVLGQYLYFTNQRASYLAFDERNNERFVNLMAAVLRSGGRAGLDDFLKIWGQGVGDTLSVRAVPLEPISAADRIPHHVAPTTTDTPPTNPPWAVTVSSPDGAWQLIYARQLWEPEAVYMLRDFVRTRTPEFILELLVSLLFSAMLAWYLTRPIQRLRIGFERLARGDLRARLHAQTLVRRDEISDLARDFDHVAERLEQLVATRDQLLHDVSHTLRTPLARLRLSIDLAKQADSEPSGTARAHKDAMTSQSLTRIDAECQRIDTLVGELLMLSRAESGIPGHDEFFDLPELVRAVVADAQLEARHGGVTMRFKSQCGDLVDTRWVTGDAELLRRGIENILRNALQHSPRGRSVEIVVRLRHGSGEKADARFDVYDIEISDQGPGVDDSALEKIFDPFVRLSGESGEGFGLGLAIARRAVHAHDGAVRAFNHVGGGLTVLISLPATVAMTEAARAPLGV